ncbi:uncharacterized protein LOC110855030 [Folsomia candida]|uniref:uncharacterized protein LOC110855030 n=1 Tax=Folsomia candida TaxID=158441 RepID=UPI000B8EEFE4|nr:uncharacterized protein LOC110855030 [Folsomia candida]
MDLPLSSTREISSHYSSHDADNATTSATLKALMNPLILDIIFPLISISDLKSCRLVNHAWAHHGATLLGKRTILDVNQLFYYSASNLQLTIHPVNEKLIKGLKLHCEFDTLARRYKAIDVVTTGLGMLKFKDIQYISVVISGWPHESCEDRCEPQKLAVHPNLTTIKYGPYEGSYLHPVLQSLIDSAPNLTFLDVWGSSLPDLESCRNLKSLKFYLISYDRIYAIGDMIEILGQVKDSVTNVELRYKNYSHYWRQMQKRSLPVMSKLVSLTIHPFEECPTLDFFNEIHLPALKILAFRNLFVSSTRLLNHLVMWQRHRGVESLALEFYLGTAHGEFAASIVQLFPAVKKFDLEIFFVCDRFINGINQLAVVQVWDLEQVNLDVDCVDESALIVVILKSLLPWKGSKRVHFKRTNLTQDDFIPHIQDIILYSAGLESLKFSGHDYVPITVELTPSQSAGVIRFTVPEIMKKMRPLLN